MVDSEGEEEEGEEIGERSAKQQKMDTLQQQMSKISEGMDELKKNVATKEDMKGVNKRLKTIESEQKNLDSRLTKLEREKANDTRPQSNRRPRPLQADMPERNASEFRRARRSVLLSPVEWSEGGLEGIKKFLINELSIPEDVVMDLQLEDIRPIHPKKLPAHRKNMEEGKKVHVSLRDSHERDLVFSYTGNLRTPARLDIVIPEFLQSTKAKLEGLAYKIRKHARESNNKKVMTSLRLDDKTEGLTMAVREEKDQLWLHYSLLELKQLESKLVHATEGEETEEEEDEFV